MKYLNAAKIVLTGENLEVLRDGAVVVEDEKIVYVGPEAQARLQYPDAEVLSHKGDCLMPGMIECHNHLAMDAREVGHLAFMAEGECEHTVSALRCLKDDLMAGITTARCLGDRHYIDVKLKAMVQEGKVVGPDLLASGIGMRASHGHGFVGMPHSGVEEFRKTARENMHRGVDFLKIFVTPGTPIVKPGEFIPCFITYDEIRTVVEEAKSMNIRTAAHCIGGKGLEYCVEAGIDCIEHVYSITPEQVRLVEENHKGWIDMTSGIVLDPDREPFLPTANAKKMRDSREYARSCMNLVYRSDKIRYTIGTDANHSLLYKELPFAVEGGSSALKAVQAVTVNAAKMCGLEEKTGQIAVGLNADIIAVDENPVDNVAILKDVRFVMKRGTVYKN